MEETTYEAITYLAGRTYIQRDFLDAATEDLDAVLAECPYDDLTEDQRGAYEAAIANSELRTIIEQWWAKYDELRAAGELPDTADPWLP